MQSKITDRLLKILPRAAWVVAALVIARGGETAFYLIGLAGAVTVVLLFQRAQLRVLLVWAALAGPLYPIVRVPRIHAFLTFDRFLLLAFAAPLLLSSERVPATKQEKPMLAAFAVLVLALGLRSFMTQGRTVSSQLTWVDAMVFPLVVYLYARRVVWTRQATVRLAGALAAGGVIMSAIGIAEQIMGFQLASWSGGTARFDSDVGVTRVSGPYPVPEVFGLVLVVCLAATLYWTLARRPKRYTLGSVAATIHCVALAIILYRAFWIATLATLLIVLGIRPKRAARAITTAALVGAIVFSLLLQFGGNKTVTERVNNTRNVAGRFAVYGIAIDLFKTHPLTGVGDQRFVVAEKELPAVSLHGAAGTTFPHSSYLGTLAEDGLLGFVPLLLMTFATWLFVHRLRKTFPDGEAAVWAAAVTAASLSYFFVSLSLTMLPYGPANAVLAAVLGAAAGRVVALERGESADEDDIEDDAMTQSDVAPSAIGAA